MSPNIKMILEQFEAEGLQEYWATIIAKAQKELSDLENAQKKLTALENAGVDNWEWYSDAMESMNQ